MFLRYEQRLTRQFNKAKQNLFEAQQIREARDAAAKKAQEAEEKNEAIEELFDGELEGCPVIPLEPPKPSILELLGRPRYINGGDPENVPPSQQPSKDQAK